MKTLFALAAAMAFVAVPVALAQDYVGGGSVDVSGVGSAGFALCQSPPSDIPLPFGVGGVCDVDCGGEGEDCIVSNSNTADSYSYCWDTDGDGIDDTCVGPGTGALSTGGFKGVGSVYVNVGGTTGSISAFDP